MWRDNPNVRDLLEVGGLTELRRSIEQSRHGMGHSYDQIRKTLCLSMEAFSQMMRELDHVRVDAPST